MTAAALVDAVGGLLAPLLGTLERIEWVQRHLYPPVAGRLADALAPHADALAGPLHVLETVAGPSETRFLRARLVEVARQSVDLTHLAPAGGVLHPFLLADGGTPTPATRIPGSSTGSRPEGWPPGTRVSGCPRA